MTLLDFPLPNAKELGELIERIRTEIGMRCFMSPAIRMNSTSLSVLPRVLPFMKRKMSLHARFVSGGRLSENEVRHVFAEKRQIVRKNGLPVVHRRRRISQPCWRPCAPEGMADSPRWLHGTGPRIWSSFLREAFSSSACRVAASHCVRRLLPAFTKCLCCA